MATGARVSIHEVDVTDSGALRGAATAIEGVSLAADLHDLGYADLALTAAEVVAWLGDQRAVRKRCIIAWGDRGEPVGWALLRLPLADNRTAAELDLVVAPTQRRRGIGRRLLEQALTLARAEGRRTLTGWASQKPPVPDDAPAAPGQLAPASGAGRLRADDPVCRFALAAGAHLAQVERHSVCRLPTDLARFARLHGEADPGGEYGLVQWRGPTPPEWLDDMCRLNERMSTDVPTGEVDWSAEVWTRDRLQRAEAATAAAGITSCYAAALHRPSGRLVGHTRLDLPAGAVRHAHQEDTLVIREHRGHHLGLWLKTANLLSTRADHPLERIHTWNAAENEYMLAINRSLGFELESCTGAWQLRLDP